MRCDGDPAESVVDVRSSGTEPGASPGGEPPSGRHRVQGLSTRLVHVPKLGEAERAVGKEDVAAQQELKTWSHLAPERRKDKFVQGLQTVVDVRMMYAELKFMN